MSQHRLVFVGAYTEPIRFGTGQILEGKGRGIYVFRLSTDTGAVEPCGLTAGVRNPSYLAFHPSRRFLYAVNEFKEFEGAASGAISAFSLDPTSGALTFLNCKATHGTDPCHLTVDPSGRAVLVANFASGSVCVLPIGKDGALGDATCVVQHHGSSVDPARQAGPHAHAVTLDETGRYLFVPDLGLDKVMVYRLDAERGAISPHNPPWVQVPAGAGPRQLVMHPRGNYAYLINELASTMIAFRYDSTCGTLHEIQELSTLPASFAGRSTCAEVQISPSGDLLLGSNRGHDSIVTFAIDQRDGTLTCLGHTATLGKTPRNFVVDPSGEFVLVANQDTDSLVVFRVDTSSGALVATGHRADVPTPVCVRVL